jgi:tetratricopeptide (TPR) repeat protein
MEVSLQLSNQQLMDQAYRELIQIDPKNLAAYEQYASCFSSQWGRSPARQQQIVSDAIRAYGADAPEIPMLRANILAFNSLDDPHSPQRVEQLLQLANESLSKSKTPWSEPLKLKCRTLMSGRQRAGMLKLAKEGYETWESLDWAFLYGHACQLRYEETHDPALLEKSRQMFAWYVAEIPYEPSGHDHLGWTLSHLGQRDAARAEFQKALQLDPDDEKAKSRMKYVQ